MIARSARLLVIVLAAAFALPAVAAATPPGANGRIAFASSDDIYSIAPDGTGLARLTFSQTTEQHPSWSPDGTQLAFGSFAEGRQSIHVMNADGTDERRLSPESYGTDDDEPAWSPDGSRVAFGSTRPFNSSWHIWVVNADGTDLHQLTSEFSTSPVWSPDGSRIAYLSGLGIWIANADGSSAHPLTFPPTSYSDERPSWSPDGSRLVFARRLTYGNAPQLYLIDATGRNERRLTFTEGASRFPSWSPDGTEIAFTHERELSAIGLDGSAARSLGFGGSVLTPDWGTATGVPDPRPPGAPTIQIFSPEDRLYPAGFEVPAIYICESATSFVISCQGDVPFGHPLDMETTGPRTFTVRATDLDGRTSTKTVSFEVLDWRAPSLTVRAPADGFVYEQGEAVEVDFECADEPGGSGIELCDGELRDGQPLDTSQAGSFTSHFWAVDRNRNLTQVEVSYRVADRTPPTISVSSPQEGAVFVLGESVVASYSCEGAVSCKASPVDTATVGAKTFTVSARDASGNGAQATRNYRVVYAFSELSLPSAPKAGEKLSVKFSLGGDHGLGVVLGSSWRGCGTAGGDASPAESRLSFQAGRYKLQIETDASWAGSCRRLAFTLADGTEHFANVTFG